MSLSLQMTFLERGRCRSGSSPLEKSSQGSAPEPRPEKPRRAALPDSVVCGAAQACSL
jgi:hypothetical protein